MRNRIALVGSLAVLSVALVRCSFLVGDAQECELPSDCPSDRTCSAGFCIRVPVGCRGIPDAGLLAVYGDTDGGNAIHFGAALSLTDSQGNPSDIDIKELNALVLALDEVNSRGIGNGRPIALHVCDYASNAEANMDAIATYLTDRVGVPALIVANSSGVLRAAQTTQPRNVLLISPNATSSEITALDNPDGGARLVWRTAPSDAIQGEVINDLLLGESTFDAGLATTQRVAIAYVNDAYGQGLKDIVLSGLLTRKTPDPLAAQFDRGGNIDALVAQLDTFNPDLTVLVAFPDDATRIINAAASTTNLKRADGHQWFFTDAVKDPGLDDNITPAGEIEGNFGTAPAKGAGLAYASFRASFQSRYGVNADTYAFVEHDYDLMYALSLAAAHAVGPSGTGELNGTTLSLGLSRLSAGTSITVGPGQFTNARTALEGGSTIDLEGASGRLQFDPATGEAPAPIELWKFDLGAIVQAAVLEPQLGARGDDLLP